MQTFFKVCIFVSFFLICLDKRKILLYYLGELLFRRGILTMKEPMIWSFFVYLSRHMWNEPGTPGKLMYLESPVSELNEVDINTWDDTMKFIAERKYNMVVIDCGDAIKYESHPEISAPDAWDKDFLKKKLDEIRALGIEPIPKLNFSACHLAWIKEYRRMISTPIFYKVCSDLIKEVCEVFGGPRLFHLGLDEENLALQHALPMVTIRQKDLLWHDINFLFAECEKNGARPWIWSDMYWEHPEDFAERMSKEALQSNWYYNVFSRKPKTEYNRIAIETYAKLDELGFEQVPTMSTCFRASGVNALQTLAHAKDKLNPDLVKGFMTVPWQQTKPSQEFAIKNDAQSLYEARRKYYPETL